MAIDGKGRPTKAQKAEADLVNLWTGHIAAYERQFQKWESRVEKILKRYRDENRLSTEAGAKFNILWSNVQTLIPAVYSKTPSSDVSRRFHDNDPVGRVASLLLERAIDYEIEHYPDFRETMKEAVLDRYLGGRGTAWARYEPHMRAVKQNLPQDGTEITEDVDEPDEELDYECAPVDYVHWRDFGHTVARTWDEVTGVWRAVYLTRQQCVDRFGEELGNEIPLDSKPEEDKKNQGANSDPGETSSRALIYEIWDKETKQALWMAKSLKKFVDKRDDPLGLENFFPCPKPLFATLTNESLIPIPDFTLYQDQARELDTLAERIDGLIQALQVKGVYDDSIGALARIFTEGQNGTLIPVKNWAAFAEKNGLSGAIDLIDLKPIYEALRTCFDAVQAVLKQIYDLTGLSDIVRGQSEANETATAQRIKGQYASLRLKSMQTSVSYFATELLQLKAQIICGKFDPKVIVQIASAGQLSPVDQQMIPQALQLLIGQERMQDPEAEQGPNPMRNFRIEVNADSMVQMDEQQEKENRNEFIQAQGAFMEKATPLVQASPGLAPLIATLWKFSVQAFKVGKTIEGEFDTVIDQLKQTAAQPQPPKQDPEMMRVQAQQQADQMRMQAEQQRAQMDMQMNQQKLQMEAQARQQEQQVQAAIEQHRNQMESQRSAQQAMMDAQFDRWKALLDAKTKIDVAEITSQTTLSAQQDAAAKGAAQ